MDTLIHKIWRISFTATLVLLIAVVLAGNTYLAVIYNKLQQIDHTTFGGSMEIYNIVYGNENCSNPEGFALAIHILTLTLLLCGIISFLSIRFARVKIPNLFK